MVGRRAGRAEWQRLGVDFNSHWFHSCLVDSVSAGLSSAELPAAADSLGGHRLQDSQINCCSDFYPSRCVFINAILSTAQRAIMLILGNSRSLKDLKLTRLSKLRVEME